MSDVKLELDTRNFLRGLRLAGPKFEQALARALTKSAFEIRDVARREAEGVFTLGGRGRQLLASPTAYKVTPARPNSLTATVEARPATAGILAKHVRGAVVGAGEDTLAVSGQRAIPLPGLRGASGRVPKRLDPAQLLARGGKGFVRGNVLLQRIGRRSARAVRVLFTLTRTARIRPKFNFPRIALETARRVWPEKARREIERIRLK